MARPSRCHRCCGSSLCQHGRILYNCRDCNSSQFRSCNRGRYYYFYHNDFLLLSLGMIVSPVAFICSGTCEYGPALSQLL